MQPHVVKRDSYSRSGRTRKFGGLQMSWGPGEKDRIQKLLTFSVRKDSEDSLTEFALPEGFLPSSEADPLITETVFFDLKAKFLYCYSLNPVPGRHLTVVTKRTPEKDSEGDFTRRLRWRLRVKDILGCREDRLDSIVTFLRGKEDKVSTATVNEQFRRDTAKDLRDLRTDCRVVSSGSKKHTYWRCL